METDDNDVRQNLENKEQISSNRHKRLRGIWNNLNATTLIKNHCRGRKNMAERLEVKNDKDLGIDEHGKDLSIHVTHESTNDNTKVRYSRKKRHTDWKKHLGEENSLCYDFRSLRHREIVFVRICCSLVIVFLICNLPRLIIGLFELSR